jgi:PAS domain S-box-containing protein
MSNEANDLFQLVFADASDCAVLLTRAVDGPPIIRDANAAALRVHGFTREEIVGRPISILVLRSEPAKTEHRQREALETGHARFEARHLRKDGTTFMAEVVVSRVRLGGEELMLAIERDITERVQEHERLEFLVATLETAPSAAYWFDPAGRFLYANPAGCKALGYTLEELRERVVGDVNPRATPARWAEIFEAIKTNGSACVETEHRRKDGSLFAVEITSSHFTCAGREYLTGFALDLTERKAAERERDVLQSQLLQAQKMESIGRLAGGVAHDFNNMLGVILGHAELALEGLDPRHALHEDLAEIRSAAERSAALTQQLLAFARKQPVSPKVLDLNETVDGILKMLRRLIREELTLTFQPGADLFPVKIDREQVHQILANLCVNARDAIEGIGHVSISTENVTLAEPHIADGMAYAAGEWVKLSVSDDGCGMDAEQTSHLFEPFFTTKDVGRGTGLGLATVYGAVQQNGGFLEVHSKPGAGTTMAVFLPRYRGSVPASEVQAELPLEPASGTLLLVEDEPAILRATQRMLERLGYRVLPASTPGHALRLAQQYDVLDLLITDVVMPEMNGRELASQVAARHPGLPCLYMSGYTADVIAQSGVLEEGVQFVQKPFTAATLAAKVRAALSA